MDVSIQIGRKTLPVQIITFCIYMCVMCLLFFLQDVLGLSIPWFVYVGYFAAGYVFFDYDYTLALSSLLPFLAHAVQTSYLMIIAVAVYFIKYGKAFKLTAAHFVMLCLLVFEIMHAFLEPFSLTAYIGNYFLPYLYIAVVVGESRIDEKLKNPFVVVKTFIFFAAYYMLDLFLMTLKYMSFRDIMDSDYRLGVSDELRGDLGLYDNQNNVALFAIVAICLIIVCMQKGKQNKFAGIASIAYFVFFGFLTSSKTFLICLGLLAVFMVLYTLRNSIKKAILLLLVLAGLIWIASFTVFSDQMARIIERFTVDDVTTGRTELFSAYNEFIMSKVQHLMLGIGLQGTAEKTGVYGSPHNAIQEVVLCWGVVGLFLLGYFIYLFFQNTRLYGKKKLNVICLLPLAIYFIFIQTIQLIRVSAIFELLLVLYVAMLAGGNDEKQKELPNYSGHRG